MISTLVVIGLVVTAVVTASVVSRPATARSRAQGAARRRRYVQQHPTEANLQDIREMLLDEGVTPEQARFITAKAVERDIKPFTMWLWLEQFDAEALGIVVAADLSHRDLLTHISNGTVPDLEELKLFASLNGLVIAGPPVRTPHRTVLVDSGVTAPERSLPPIHAPGTWPGQPARQRRPRLGEGGLAA